MRVNNTVTDFFQVRMGKVDLIFFAACIQYYKCFYSSTHMHGYIDLVIVMGMKSGVDFIAASELITIYRECIKQLQALCAFLNSI